MLAEAQRAKAPSPLTCAAELGPMVSSTSPPSLAAGHPYDPDKGVFPIC